MEWQTKPYCSDGASTVVSPSGSFVYYACAANQGLWNATSGGWAGNGIGTCTTTFAANCYKAHFVPPLVLDPENPSTLYFGAQAPSGTAQVIYQTTNGAQSWQAISPDLSSGQSGPQITAIGIAPTNPSVVFAGTGGMGYGKVWETNNATAGVSSTWQEVDSGLPKRTVTAVLVDPTSPTTAYVSYSGFSSCSACDRLGHIFKTTNSGISWSNITGNLPDIPVDALVIDPAVTNTIYAATDVGVFATNNGGNIWTPLVAGLPNVAVLGLTLDPPTRTLWAGTHGRSVWALQLPQPDFAVSSSPNSATVSPGSSASYTISVAAKGGVGFTNSVSLACSGLPALASCTFSPASVTPGSGTTTSTLTIITTAASSGRPLSRRLPTLPVFSVWLGLLLVFSIGIILAKKAGQKLAEAFAFAALVLCLGSALMACAGGSPSNGRTSSSPGTPAGTYGITVTGSSNQLQHSTPVTLVVL